jgi:hypothetical protein
MRPNLEDKARRRHKGKGHQVTHHLVEADGASHTYSFNLVLEITFPEKSKPTGLFAALP